MFTLSVNCVCFFMVFYSLMFVFSVFLQEVCASNPSPGSQVVSLSCLIIFDAEVQFIGTPDQLMMSWKQRSKENKEAEQKKDSKHNDVG